MTENEAKQMLRIQRTFTNGANGKIEAIDTAISALEEIREYRALGTVEELREAMEKQRAKKGISKKGFAAIHNECPSCGYNLFGNIPSAYCPNCGQCIDWSEVEE